MLQSCFDALRLFLKYNSSVFLSLPLSSRFSVYAAVTVLAKGSWALPSTTEEEGDKADVRHASSVARHSKSDREKGHAFQRAPVLETPSTSGTASIAPGIGGSLGLRLAALRLLQTHAAVFLTNIVQDIIVAEKRRPTGRSTCKAKDELTYGDFVSSLSTCFPLPAVPLLGGGSFLHNLEEEARVGSILDGLLLLAVSPVSLQLSSAGVNAFIAVVGHLLSFCGVPFQANGRRDSSLSCPRSTQEEGNLRPSSPVERPLSTRESHVVCFEEGTDEKRTNVLDTAGLNVCLQRLKRLLRQLYWGILESGQELLEPSTPESLTLTAKFFSRRSEQVAGVLDEDNLVAFRRCGVLGRLLVLLLGPSAARSGLSTLLCQEDGKWPRVMALNASRQLLRLSDTLLSEDRQWDLREGTTYSAGGGGARAANVGLIAKYAPLVVHPAAVLIQGALSVSKTTMEKRLSNFPAEAKKEPTGDLEATPSASSPKDFRLGSRQGSLDRHMAVKGDETRRLVQSTAAAARPLLRQLATVAGRLVDWFIDISSFYSYTSSFYKKPQIAAAFGAACVALISAREVEERQIGAVSDLATIPSRDIAQWRQSKARHVHEEGTEGHVTRHTLENVAEFAGEERDGLVQEEDDDSDENAGSLGEVGELLDILIQQSLLVALRGETARGRRGDRRTNKSDSEFSQEEGWDAGEEKGVRGSDEKKSSLFPQDEEPGRARSRAVGELWRRALLAVGIEEVPVDKIVVPSGTGAPYVPLPAGTSAQSGSVKGSQIKDGRERRDFQGEGVDPWYRRRGENPGKVEDTMIDGRQRVPWERAGHGKHSNGESVGPSFMRFSAPSYYQRQLGDSLLRCCLGLFRLGVSAHFLLHQQQLVLLHDLRRAVASAASGDPGGGESDQPGLSGFSVSATERLLSPLFSSELSQASSDEESARFRAAKESSSCDHTPRGASGSRGFSQALSPQHRHRTRSETLPGARTREEEKELEPSSSGSHGQASRRDVTEEKGEGASVLGENRGGECMDDVSFDVGKAAERVYRAAVFEQQTSANAALLLSLGFLLESTFLTGQGHRLLFLLLPW